MTAILLTWIANSLAILALGYLWPSLVSVVSAREAFIAGALLSLVNAIVRPILVILTLPLTILTLGLFYFVVTAICLRLVAVLRERLLGAWLSGHDRGLRPDQPLQRLHLSGDRRRGEAVAGCGSGRSRPRHWRRRPSRAWWRRPPRSRSSARPRRSRPTGSSSSSASPRMRAFRSSAATARCAAPSGRGSGSPNGWPASASSAAR